MAEKNTNLELDGMLKAIWDSLTEEQKKKARKCKSMDELMLLAGREGIELPDELLDEVAGGIIVKRGEGTPFEYFSVYSDRGTHARDFKTQREAWEFAEKIGVDTTVMTEEQFRARKSGC